MTFGDWLTQHFSPILKALLPVALWMGYWLFAVDWRKVWPVLREGAWAPCVLLVLISAITWSRVAPGPCSCLGGVTLPNFWWQLGAVSGLAGCALFAGWLQGVLGYTPLEVSVEPAPHGHGHDHGQDHGHDRAADHGHSHDHGHGHH